MDENIIEFLTRNFPHGIEFAGSEEEKDELYFNITADVINNCGDNGEQLALSWGELLEIRDWIDCNLRGAKILN